MADYSSAAQIAAIAAPLAAVIMTVIKVRGLSTMARPGGMYTGDRNDRGLTTVVCPDHSGLVAG